MPATSMRSRVWSASSHIISSRPTSHRWYHSGSALTRSKLLGAVGEVEHAALVEARRDTLGSGDAADLVDGIEHRALHVDGALAPALLGDRLERGREERRDPAAVAAGCAEAGDLLLDEHDAQRRVELGKVVGGPQRRVPAAHDGDVAIEGAGQRFARLQRLVDEVEPHAAAAVAGLVGGPGGAACRDGRRRCCHDCLPGWTAGAWSGPAGVVTVVDAIRDGRRSQYDEIVDICGFRPADCEVAPVAERSTAPVRGARSDRARRPGGPAPLGLLRRRSPGGVVAHDARVEGHVGSRARRAGCGPC